MKKILEQGFEPWTFRATIECSNSWATRGPNCYATTDIKALQLMNGAISRWCNDREERQYNTLWCILFDVLWSAFIRYTIYSYKIDADILKPSTNVQNWHSSLDLHDYLTVTCLFTHKQDYGCVIFFSSAWH